METVIEMIVKAWVERVAQKADLLRETLAIFS